ncbi:hypothetical protein [Laspinema olomoucense]|uniref:PLD phosphodiesterase domain-containing protein n=1 Tax=Laspinema olomoucense D3b TaxID=2953688 RepID=A0ABT2ND86_9CYAN|nr:MULTISPECIES: hypothetical protein [unclassified Laspinema]MCT7980647.1 hypothetical protein [Laspinema sp. D3b]MCT7988648.1 hypothetical protein [Laspinema sp. D3a]
MFLESSAKPIDSSLQTSVEKLEKTSPGLSVIAARQFCYPLVETGIELMVTAPRKFNVLEEFILRASLEITPKPTEVELAQVLGLDPIFVRSTTANLQALNTLKILPDGSLQLTPEGRTFYEKGSVPQPPESHPIYAIADPLLEATAFELNPLRESALNLPNLGDFLPLNSRIPRVDSLTLAEVQQCLIHQGLGFHRPESGKEVTAFQIAQPPETRWQSVALFAIFDTLNQRLTLQLRRGQQLLESATLWLETLQSEGKISLTELFEICSTRGEESFPQENPEVEARLEQVRQAAIEPVTDNVEENSTPTGRAILISESQIHTQFLETLQTATHQVLIYSPRFTEQGINYRLLQGLETLVKRGVWILVGQGTIPGKLSKITPISQEWLTKLAAVKTAEGLSAIQIVALEESHAKEVVIDRQIYICSAHNWLTYGGDRLPLGESLYQVTLPEIVSEAYQSLSTQFQQRAESLWQQAITTQDESLATTSLSIWGALGMAETALQQIQDREWLELLPIWLKIACQGLRSQQMSPDSPSLNQALSQLSKLTPDSPQLDSLCEAWRQVMGVIADQDGTIALNLLSEPVWQDFIRLGIASEAVESPDAFIAGELAKLAANLSPTQNPPRKKSKHHKSG